MLVDDGERLRGRRLGAHDAVVTILANVLSQRGGVVVRAATDERLIAEAAAASTRAYNDAAALTEGVRKDGHDGIVGAESATAKALAIIDEHLPALRVDADAALKAGNVASFLRFYDAAEGKRRERLLDAQGAALVGAFRADDVGLTSAPAPFILPAAHVR